MLPFVLTVFGILIASYQGWHDSRPKWERPSKKRMSGRRWLILSTTVIAIVISTVNSFPQVEYYLQPQRNVVTYLKIGRVGPHCTAASLIVYPTGRMKSFQMTLEFDQPIKAHVLQTGFNNDLNMGIQSKVSMNGDTCNINASSSERNDSLTFQVASDQHAVLINGRNFARFDAQTIVLTFFSDSGAIATAKANGMATSESGGHDVPANVLLVRGANNTETLKP